MRIAFILMMTTHVVCGCTNQNFGDLFEPPVDRFSEFDSAYVMLAEGGASRNTNYRGSGKILSREIGFAISGYLDAVHIGTETETRSQVFEKALTQGIELVFEPEILHWDDRSTAWLAKPDQVTIRITVWDPLTAVAISTDVVGTSSRLEPSGGDHPQDLLPRLIEAYTDRLFR